MTKGELYALAYQQETDWRQTYKKSGYWTEPELRAMECLQAHGATENFSGTVDAPTGFFYRLDKWMVVVDQQGFCHLYTHRTPEECRQAFNKLDDEYSDWDNEYIEL